MPCASLKMADSVNSVKRNTLFRYFNTSEKTKGYDYRKQKDAPKDSEGQEETGSESKKIRTEASGPRKFQPQWTKHKQSLYVIHFIQLYNNTIITIIEYFTLILLSYGMGPFIA